MILKTPVTVKRQELHLNRMHVSIAGRLQFFLANHQGSDMKKRFDNRINMNIRDKY